MKFGFGIMFSGAGTDGMLFGTGCNAIANFEEDFELTTGDK